MGAGKSFKKASVLIKNIIIVILSLCISVGAYFSLNVIDNLKSVITTLIIKHKKDKVKLKVKERGKRLIAAIPIAGVVAVGWFEKEEYDEWMVENPDGTIDEYTSEITDATTEVAVDIADNYCNDMGDFCSDIKEEIVEFYK